MKNNTKTEEFKEKLKQALTSTARVISDDLDLKDDSNQNKSSKKFDFFKKFKLLIQFRTFIDFKMGLSLFS